MSYSIDFSKITLEQYKKQLEGRSFIPSRQILKDKADIHFHAFKKAKINNLKELHSIISNKKAKAELLKDEDVSEEYVAILLRELNSIQSKPLKLNEFDWVSNSAVSNLEGSGIVNTQVLYEKLGKANERKRFSEAAGIDERDIVELLKLCDLTRIQWVNSTFAHVLYEAGFDTVAKVSMADYKELFEKVSLRNDELKLYKGKIGLNDMKLCIEAARSIDAEIEV